MNTWPLENGKGVAEGVAWGGVAGCVAEGVVGEVAEGVGLKCGWGRSIADAGGRCRRRCRLWCRLPIGLGFLGVLLVVLDCGCGWELSRTVLCGVLLVVFDRGFGWEVLCWEVAWRVSCGV